MRYVFFFFNDTATTEIYTLSLHDALPISPAAEEAAEKPSATTRERSGKPTGERSGKPAAGVPAAEEAAGTREDRKSTRLNSSHANISYAVFCLKKKKNDP